MDARRKREAKALFSAYRHLKTFDPAADLMKKEMFEALDRALHDLPFRQKSVFVLSEIHGLCLAEISRIEKSPVGAIKSRLSKAKKKLRFRLNAYTREKSRYLLVYLSHVHRGLRQLSHQRLKQYSRPHHSSLQDSQHQHGAHYRIRPDRNGGAGFPRTKVPNGHCFVLGDNRGESVDSRHFGPVPLRDVMGRVDFIYLPAKTWSRFGALKNAAVSGEKKGIGRS
ncbi:sigma-70, region 4 [delta proteobacterium NaphS2]|nr:sigma-70, region 4 [delta proteobacterium NaphS2]